MSFRLTPRALSAAIGIAVLLASLGAVASVRAENPRINTETFRPSPHASDLFATITSDLPAAGTWAAALWLAYGKNPLVFVDLAGVAPDDQVIADQLVLHAGGAFTVSDRLSLGLALPFFLVNDGADRGPDSLVPLAPVPGSALGDLRVSAKVGIVVRAPDADGLGLALELPLGLPTGNPDAFVSDGWSFAPALALDLRLGALRAAVNVGLRLRSSETLAIGTDIGHEALFRVAASYTLVPALVDVLAEVQGASHNFALSNDTYVEGLIGGRLALGDDGLALTLAGGRGFATGYGSTEMKLVASLGWSPPPTPVVVDSDGDRVFDDVDECPREPEDPDGFQDHDGCPEPDNDGDGVLDVGDRCIDGHEDVDGFEDDDGCADLDDDQDGIADLSDGLAGACRNIPEDKDGFQDEDGCPDPDNDGDGILDASDGCPLDAVNRCGVSLDPCEIKIDQTIFFAFDRADVLPESFAILDAVAAVLGTNEAIARIEVQGHSDSLGAADYNLALSQRRAEAVVARILATGKGIAPARLVAKGYGLTRPLVANTNPANRAKNRRVQFIITDPAQSGCGQETR